MMDTVERVTTVAGSGALWFNENRAGRKRRRGSDESRIWRKVRFRTDTLAPGQTNMSICM